MEIMEKITVGACREETMTVGVQHTAQALGSGSLPVLGTPAMTALMEKAATNLAQELLPEGWTSVGTALKIEHLAATPVGAAVRAMATVEALEGRRVSYKVEAFDDAGLIGRGTHDRVAVEAEKFLAKAQDKLNKK